MMEKFIRAFLRFIFKASKVNVVWLKNQRKYPKTVLYISNHVSTLDILFYMPFYRADCVLQLKKEL